MMLFLNDGVAIHQCRRCREKKPATEFYFVRGRGGVGSKPMVYCKVCNNRLGCERSKRKFASDPAFRARVKAATRKAMLLRKYGLSEQAFEEKWASQGGVCAICKKPENRVRGGKITRMNVDHDHATGQVRDLLCTRCNTVVGVVETNGVLVEMAKEYVKRHSARLTDSAIPSPTPGGCPTPNPSPLGSGG